MTGVHGCTAKKKNGWARAVRLLYDDSRGERTLRSLLRGLAASVYEWNRECRGLASDQNNDSSLRIGDSLQLASGSFNGGLVGVRRHR